jgi:hypothetical protein
LLLESHAAHETGTNEPNGSSRNARIGTPRKIALGIAANAFQVVNGIVLAGVTRKKDKGQSLAETGKEVKEHKTLVTLGRIGRANDAVVDAHGDSANHHGNNAKGLSRLPLGVKVDIIRICVALLGIVDVTVIFVKGPSLVVPESKAQKVVAVVDAHVKSNVFTGKVGNERADPGHEGHERRQAHENAWLSDIVRNGLREAAGPERRHESSKW